MMDSETTVYRRARVPGRDGLASVLVRDGRIAAIEDDAARPNAVDLAGRLILPGFVDGHVHLDKTFLGCPWQPHRPGASVAARIAAEKAQRAALPVPLAERAARLIERMLALGTVAMRCHVDIDETLGLSHLETLLAVRERYRDRMAIQFVAFPQSGISGRVPDLLDAAVRAGAEVIGGLDPAGIDQAIDRHLDVVFGLAERHGVRVDIHLHDPGTLGAFELRQIAGRAKALGLQGRVAVSHAFALGQIGEDDFARTAAALATGGVAIMTNGPGADTIPPVGRLLDAGVRVFAGCDNIRDAWSPYGSGDMLERAGLIGYRADMRGDADLARAFDLVTAAPRAVLGLPPQTVAAGAPADLVAVPAETVAEAVATCPRDRLVIRAGRIMAGADTTRGEDGHAHAHPNATT